MTHADDQPISTGGMVRLPHFAGRSCPVHPRGCLYTGRLMIVGPRLHAEVAE